MFQGNYRLEDCLEYIKSCVKDYVVFLRDKGLRFGCFGKGYQCRLRGVRFICKKCVKYYFIFLYEDLRGKKEYVKVEEEIYVGKLVVNVVINWVNVVEGVIISLMILFVWVYFKDYL